jgi:exodeoxyribonuclease VII large subunit
VLARGYSVTTREVSGEVLRDSRQVQPGERILTRLAAGQLVSRIE